jgi:hypothetical protein
MTDFESMHPRIGNGSFTEKTQSAPQVRLATPPLLAGSPAPLIELDRLTHVGTLDPNSKGSFSYEGAGLSVSQHPGAWARIARLGGPVWDVPNATMLDYHELSDAQRDAITAFGLERGYVTVQPTVTATYWDNEWDQAMTSEFATRDEAESEMSEQDGVTFAAGESVVASGSFPDSTVKAGDMGVEQVLATLWVEETTELDGVWWEDDLDVERLSAPRGVLARGRIAAFVAGATPAAPRDDDFDE